MRAIFFTGPSKVRLDTLVGAMLWMRRKPEPCRPCPPSASRCPSRENARPVSGSVAVSHTVVPSREFTTFTPPAEAIAISGRTGLNLTRAAPLTGTEKRRPPSDRSHRTMVWEPTRSSRRPPLLRAVTTVPGSGSSRATVSRMSPSAALRVNASRSVVTTSAVSSAVKANAVMAAGIPVIQRMAPAVTSTSTTRVASATASRWESRVYTGGSCGTTAGNPLLRLPSTASSMRRALPEPASSLPSGLWTRCRTSPSGSSRRHRTMAESIARTQIRRGGGVQPTMWTPASSWLNRSHSSRSSRGTSLQSRKGTNSSMGTTAPSPPAPATNCPSELITTDVVSRASADQRISPESVFRTDSFWVLKGACVR